MSCAECSGSLRDGGAKSAVADCFNELVGWLLSGYEDSVATVFNSPPAPPGGAGPLCEQAMAGSCKHLLRLVSISMSDCPELDLLGFLQDLLRLSGTCGLAVCWFGACISALADALDNNMINGCLPCLLTRPVGIKQPRAKKRMLRIDEGLVHYVATDMVASKKYRSAARVARASGCTHERTARDMEITTMSNYMWSSSKVFANCANIFVVNDDGRVGGEKNQFGVIWSSEVERGAWLVPQALL